MKNIITFAIVLALIVSCRKELNLTEENDTKNNTLVNVSNVTEIKVPSGFQ